MPLKPSNNRVTFSEPTPSAAASLRVNQNRARQAVENATAGLRGAHAADDIFERPSLTREEATVYFSLISDQLGGDEHTVETSVTIIEAVQNEPDPQRRPHVLRQQLLFAGSYVVAQAVALGLLWNGCPLLAARAQGIASQLFLRLCAAPLRWLGIIGG